MVPFFGSARHFTIQHGLYIGIATTARDNFAPWRCVLLPWNRHCRFAGKNVLRIDSTIQCCIMKCHLRQIRQILLTYAMSYDFLFWKWKYSGESWPIFILDNFIYIQRSYIFIGRNRPLTRKCKTRHTSIVGCVVLCLIVSNRPRCPTPQMGPQSCTDPMCGALTFLVFAQCTSPITSPWRFLKRSIMLWKLS